MLKTILRTALVAAGVACITPFAGAQGYPTFGPPLIMGRIGGSVVTPGVFSVINPSARYLLTTSTLAPMNPALVQRSPITQFTGPLAPVGTHQFLARTTANGAVIGNTATTANVTITPGMAVGRPNVVNPIAQFTGPLQPVGSHNFLSAPRAMNPAPTPGFRQAFGGRVR